MKDSPEKLETQLQYLQQQSPPGVVIFSYDDIAGNEKLQKSLLDKF